MRSSLGASDQRRGVQSTKEWEKLWCRFRDFVRSVVRQLLYLEIHVHKETEGHDVSPHLGDDHGCSSAGRATWLREQACGDPACFIHL